MFYAHKCGNQFSHLWLNLLLIVLYQFFIVCIDIALSANPNAWGNCSKIWCRKLPKLVIMMGSTLFVLVVVLLSSEGLLAYKIIKLFQQNKTQRRSISRPSSRTKPNYRVCITQKVTIQNSSNARMIISYKVWIWSVE